MPELTLVSKGKLNDAGICNVTMVLMTALTYLMHEDRFGDYRDFATGIAMESPSTLHIRDWFLRLEPEHLFLITQFLASDQALEMFRQEIGKDDV